jgi:predicted HAD superfamily Cof-like phosphohydrolase
MKTFFDDVAAFHEKFGLTVEDPHRGPRLVLGELALLRQARTYEEQHEYENATNQAHAALKAGDIDLVTKLLAEQVDALVDLVYIVLGTAYLHGFDFNEAWRRVHEKNMEKVRAERAEQSKHGSTFDIIKPAGWEPPNHLDLVINNFHSSSPYSGD